MSRTFLLILLALVLAVSPLTWSAWAKNEAYLGLISLCFQPETQSAQPLAGDAWWQAIASHCQRDTVGEESAFQAVLTQSVDRISVIRAAMSQSVSLARIATSKFPTNQTTQFWLGDSLYAEGDTSGAIQAYERGLQIKPNMGTQWLLLGKLYQKQDNWEKAVKAFDQACYYIDTGKNGCPSAGRLYMGHGLYYLAEQRYRDEIRQLPYWLPAKRGLADALLAQGKIDEAIPNLKILAENGDTQAQKILQGIQSNQP